MMTPLRSLSACGAAALGFLAAACDGPLRPHLSSTDAETAVAMARVNGAVATPFKAAFFTGLAAPLAPHESCGDPPRLFNIQEGFGEATKLGRFSIRITFCIDATDILDDGRLTEGESLPYDNGAGTLIAANGDELHITISGAVLPSDHPDFDFEFMDPFQISGGSGRFEGATGNGMTNSLVDFQAARTQHKWSGTLVLPRGK
jgi:hypothetical protein